MLDVLYKILNKYPYIMVLLFVIGWGSLQYDVLYNLLVSNNSNSNSSTGFPYNNNDDRRYYFDDDFNDNNNDDSHVCYHSSI